MMSVIGLSHLVLIVSVAGLALAGIDRYHPESLDELTRSVRRNPEEDSAQFWYEEAWAGIRSRSSKRPRSAEGKAKNVVMFLGDGMSVPTLAAARTLLGQLSGATGEEAQLSFEKFPATGLSKTYCANAQVPDSACTATSYLCGVKPNQGTLGVTAAVPRWDCDASTNLTNRVPSIAEWALDDGRDAGIVTTTRITHASPAGVYAKAANRHWENDETVKSGGFDTDRCPDIAHQLIHMHPGNKFKVILGGGRQQFIPTYTVDEEGSTGLRTDDRNLIDEWQLQKQQQNVSYKYVWNRPQLMEVFNDPPEYLLGLFENNHLQYHLERDVTTEPTLAELTEVAIRSLSKNERGFFLFVESGRIDHGHHDNFARLALDETIEMSKAVDKAVEMLSEEDSLIVVTADHGHVLAFNGYGDRGSPILGSNRRGRDGVSYMTLSYTNGPGARRQVDGVRHDVTLDPDLGTPRWRSDADAPLESETHSGDDVAVFARGPQHGMFSGLYEQSQIPHLMAYAACIGPGPHACNTNAANINQLTLIALLPFIVNVLIKNLLPL